MAALMKKRVANSLLLQNIKLLLLKENKNTQQIGMAINYIDEAIFCVHAAVEDHEPNVLKYYSAIFLALTKTQCNFDINHQYQIRRDCLNLLSEHSFPEIMCR